MRITLVTTLALTLAGALAAPGSAAVTPDNANSAMVWVAQAGVGVQPVVTDTTAPAKQSRSMDREDFNNVMLRLAVRGSQSPLSIALPEAASLALLLAGAWLLSTKGRQADRRDWSHDSYDY